jgi:hypothetical protein
MPLYEHHFLSIDGNPGIIDSSIRTNYIATIDYNTEDGDVIKLRYIGSSKIVYAIAVTLPIEISSHPNRSKWLHEIFENALAALRISDNPKATPYYASSGSFLWAMNQSESPEPEYPLTIEVKINEDYHIDIQNLIGNYNVISSNTKMSLVGRMLSEAVIPSIPPHYAVLSLIRAIELLWPNQRDRDAALAEREQEFAALNISQRSFVNSIHEIRTKCAHGVSRGRTNPISYAGLAVGTPLVALADLLKSIVINGMIAEGLGTSESS